jgi:hypothetical protein
MFFTLTKELFRNNRAYGGLVHGVRRPAAGPSHHDVFYKLTANILFFPIGFYFDQAGFVYLSHNPWTVK